MKTFNEVVLSEAVRQNIDELFESNLFKHMKKPRVKMASLNKMQLDLGKGLLSVFFNVKMADGKDTRINVLLDIKKDEISSVEQSGEGIIYSAATLPKSVQKPSKWFNGIIQL